MQFLCKIFRHRFKYLYDCIVIGPGEPLPNGGVIFGVPTKCKHYECSFCGKEKDIRT
jgi:hypothetical protein